MNVFTVAERPDLAEPESLGITGTVAEWEEWIGLRFPEGWEPNVWMHHPLG